MTMKFSSRIFLPSLEEENFLLFLFFFHRKITAVWKIVSERKLIEIWLSITPSVTSENRNVM